MFNIGFAELILVLIIAYVIVGPKDLPKVARWLARMVKRARQLIREIREESGWDDMMAETADVRRDIEDAVKEGRQAFRENVNEAEKDTMKKS